MAKRTERETVSGVERLYNLRAASESLGVSAWTLRRWAQQGRTDYVRLGARMMFTESQLRALVAHGTKHAYAPECLRMV